MNKSGSRFVLLSAISCMVWALLSGCVTQTYRNGIPVAEEDNEAAKSKEAFREISRVINSYKGEYADLHFEKTFLESHLDIRIYIRTP